MNRKEAKELMPIIQAFAEGKTIQCSNRTFMELKFVSLLQAGVEHTF